jgi:hypothetical protein
MSLRLATWTIVGLDVLTIGYTLAVFLRGGMPRRLAVGLGAAGLGWLGLLHLAIQRHEPLPTTISGAGFLAVVLLGVAACGAALFGSPGPRRALSSLEHPYLLAPQAVRLVVGATFLLWALTGVLPRAFGVLDGCTHMAAGALGAAAAYRVRSPGGMRRRGWRTSGAWATSSSSPPASLSYCSTTSAPTTR